MALRRTYWTCQLLGWFAAATTNMLLASLSERAQAAPWQYAIVFFSGAAIAVACTHGYRAFIKRRRWVTLSLGRMLPRLIGASLVVGITIVVLATPVWIAVFQDNVSPVSSWAPPAVLGWSWMVFVWNVLYFGVHYFERWRQSEVEK
ncbi:MAG: hypothetical protein ABI867_11030, partial [Kofleriaceae bacterium]